MSHSFSGKQSDRRLTAIFESFKTKFSEHDHILLGRPYPDKAPAPVWNSNIGVAAGNANTNTLLIQINPNYLMPLERSDELRNTILHEMLHVYVVHYYQCRGHEGQWKSIAQHWGLDQYHCMCMYHGLKEHGKGQTIMDVHGKASDSVHTHKTLYITKYRKRRVLP